VPLTRVIDLVSESSKASFRKNGKHSRKKSTCPSSRKAVVRVKPHELARLLEKKGRVLFAKEWKIVHESLIYEKNRQVFFIDTEFGKSTGKVWLFEIAILNSEGACILNEKIDHNCTIQDLFDQPGMSECSRQHLCNIYGIRFKSRAMATTWTSGISIEELKLALVRLIPAGSTMVQWSKNNCDYNAVASWVPENCIPPKPRWLQAIPAWRQILPGVDLSLEYFYEALFPKCPLNGSHHRAKGDTEKLYRAVAKMMDFVRFDKKLGGFKSTRNGVAKSAEPLSRLPSAVKGRLCNSRKSVRRVTKEREEHGEVEESEDSQEEGEDFGEGENTDEEIEDTEENFEELSAYDEEDSAFTKEDSSSDVNVDMDAATDEEDRELAPLISAFEQIRRANQVVNHAILSGLTAMPSCPKGPPLKTRSRDPTASGPAPRRSSRLMARRAD
jgi:hypothetical protein